MKSKFHELLEIDVNARDSAWETQFFAEFIHQNVKLLFSQPQNGPDGFAYLLVETTDEGGEPVMRVIEWLSTRGIGLVVNPRNTYPDYVFTFGMLWNFRERGEFLTSTPAQSGGKVELQAGSQIWVAEPTPSYLPDYVRSLLKQFLMDQGVLKPRLLLMSTDQKQYDFAFSLESLGTPPESERMGVAEAIGWFLPAHYPVALLSEKTLDGFVDL